MRVLKGAIINGDGSMTIALENIWRRVRRFAQRHGYEYVSSYGVVGVAAT